MKNKSLTKLISESTFIKKTEKKILLQNKKIFESIPISKVLLRRLTETPSTLEEKLKIIKKNQSFLKTLSSACIGLLVDRSLDRVKERIEGAKQLTKLGIEGQSIGLLLSNGNIPNKIKGTKKLQKLEISNHSIGLILQFGDIDQKIKQTQQLQKLGLDGHAIGIILNVGDSTKKIKYTKQLANLGLSGNALALVVHTGNIEEKITAAQKLKKMV